VAREARSALPGGESCVTEHPLLVSIKCPSSLNFNDAIDIFTKSKARKGVF